MELSFLRKYLPLALFMMACRKDVTLKLPEYRQKLVIDASIETGLPAYVFLSTSVPYFGDFDLNKPEGSFVKNALVIVSDGDKNDTLRAADPSRGYFYFGSRIKGQIGHRYTLKV